MIRRILLKIGLVKRVPTLNEELSEIRNNLNTYGFVGFRELQIMNEIEKEINKLNK